MKKSESASVTKPLFRPRLLEVFKKPPTRAELGTDVLSGMTVGLIALPLALALGIASVPQGVATPYAAPAIGLFTTIFAGLLISSFGGCRAQIGGPSATFIPVVLFVLERYGYGGLIQATIMAGIILVVMGVAHMGTLIKYIPWPVTSGFTTGIAVMIMATQIGEFSGISSTTPPPREFIGKCSWLVENGAGINFSTLVLGVACCALIYYWPRLGFKKIPGSVIAMLVSTLIVTILSLDKSLSIATLSSRFGVNALPASLPDFSLPVIDLSITRELIAPASAIALLSAIESLLSAVVADGLSNDRHDSNTELIAQGIANIFCPFFGGLPATGALARTSANITNGAKSPISGIVHSLLLLLIVMFFSSYAVYIPMVAMSAVLIMVSLRMGEWHELRRIREMPMSDAVVLITTFALTVLIDVVVAVEVGMILAALLFIRRVAATTEVSPVTENDVLESPEQVAQGKKIPDEVLVYRIFGPFLFGAAEKMYDAIDRLDRLPKVLILRLHLVTAMDMTALHALLSVVERIRKNGGTVILSGIHHQPLGMMRQANSIPIVGRENFCGNFDESLARAQIILNKTKADEKKIQC